jgi:hypothetical protein
MTNTLEGLLQRTENWPESAKHQLLEFADEIERELAGDYDPTLDELRAIDEARMQIARGEVADEAEVAAAFAKFHRA